MVRPAPTSCAEGRTVIGCYCLAAGAIGHAEAPSTMKRDRPDPVQPGRFVVFPGSPDQPATLNIGALVLPTQARRAPLPLRQTIIPQCGIARCCAAAKFLIVRDALPHHEITSLTI
jgi:hypothetical protein